MSNRVVTSIRIDKDLLKEFKLIAVKEDTTQSQLIVKLIEDYVRKDKDQTKLNV